MPIIRKGSWRIERERVDLVQGEGYHCIDTECEKQCSTDGRACVDVSAVKSIFSDCNDPFAIAHTTHVCVPPGDLTTQIRGLEAKYRRELQRWAPTGNQAEARTEACAKATHMLACFSVFRECKPSTDVELPLCAETCLVYERVCGVPPERSCDLPLFRVTRVSSECSGSSNPKDYLSREEIVGIVFGSVVAALLIGLVILLLCCRWGMCCDQRGLGSETMRPDIVEVGTGESGDSARRLVVEESVTPVDGPERGRRWCGLWGNPWISSPDIGNHAMGGPLRRPARSGGTAVRKISTARVGVA
jgi:hypothetical protein